ncbi:MAG: ribosomal protection-like ABC-F family protein [Anaerolineae bacterium]
MLQASNLGKRFADNLLFEKASVIINRRDRIGLVGPNGSGKTTLLRILLGEDQPDTGSVRSSLPRERIGYLPQALEYAACDTVRTVLAGAHDADEEDLVAEVQRLAEQLAASGDDLAAVTEHYAEALERLENAQLGMSVFRMERILAGLGLQHLQPDTPVAILSGGQKTRLGLARILLENPALILLDEPTNHLDIVAMEWLEAYLREYAGAMVVVSHDRAFLDRIVNQVLEIDPLKRAITAYAGSYSDYAEAKRREAEKHAQAYQDQQERIAKLEAAVNQLKGRALGIEKSTIDFAPRKIAKKIAHQAVVRQRRIERMIESEDHLEKPQMNWNMKLDFVNTPPSGQRVLAMEGVAKAFGEHLLFQDVNLTLERGERIVLLGPNGSGKSTLLRMIAGVEPASAGTLQLGANVKLGYFAQEQERLDWRLTPFQIVRDSAALSESEARGFLHFFLFAGDEVFVPVGKLSYGERARLALGVLVLQGANLLLLDEPINHLDIPSRESFERALSSFEGTVLAAVHDRYFVQRFASGIWGIAGSTIRRHADLEDYRRWGAALD